MHASQIAKGLCALHWHSPQILHRDMKTLNVLIATDMTVRLADFGLSNFSSFSDAKEIKNKGTAAYIAPEVIENEPFTGAADIYALGIVYFEMIYVTIHGKYQRPYAEYAEITGPAQRQILMYQSSKKGLRPTLPEAAPQALKDLFQSMVTHNPKDRPDILLTETKIDQITNLYKQNVTEWRQLRTTCYWDTTSYGPIKRKSLWTTPRSLKRDFSMSSSSPDKKKAVETEVNVIQ